MRSNKIAGFLCCILIAGYLRALCQLNQFAAKYLCCAKAQRLFIDSSDSILLDILKAEPEGWSWKVP